MLKRNSIPGETISILSFSKRTNPLQASMQEGLRNLASLWAVVRTSVAVLVTGLLKIHSLRRALILGKTPADPRPTLARPEGLEGEQTNHPSKDLGAKSLNEVKEGQSKMPKEAMLGVIKGPGKDSLGTRVREIRVLASDEILKLKVVDLAAMVRRAERAVPHPEKDRGPTKGAPSSKARG
jgi:hypothetical protein